MKSRVVLAGVIFSTLGLAGFMLMPSPAYAQNDPSEEADDYTFDDYLNEIKERKEDQKRCRNLGDSISKSEQQDACTRLIESAPNENDLVGEYYIDRALTREDAAEQCKDVSKGLEIIENFESSVISQSFVDAAYRLKESACD